MKSLDFPLTLLILTSGGAIVERVLPRALDTEMTHYFLIIFKAMTVVAVILFVDKISKWDH